MLYGDKIHADPELVAHLKSRTTDVGAALQGRASPVHGETGAVAPLALSDFLRALSAARDAHDGLLRDADGYFNDATFALASINRDLEGHEGEFSRAFNGLTEV